jgi:hypothetical protein
MPRTIRTVAVPLAAAIVFLTTAPQGQAQYAVWSAPPTVAYYPAPLVAYYPTTVHYYSAPSVSYYATPTVSYIAPPTVSYYAAPVVTYYGVPATTTTTTRYGLFGQPRVTTRYYSPPVYVWP